MSLQSNLACVRRTAQDATGKLAWLPPTLARLALGLVFLLSGWGKLHNLGMVTNYFTELGIPLPALNATLVAWTEFVCGALLLLGFLSRLAAVPLMGVMAVAILTAKRSEIAGLTDLFGQMEFAFLLLLAWVAIAGPGPLSLERLLHRRQVHRPAPA
ncbi:MAG: DoxX family protein [Myxococcaceae bacterium]|nr:DoxX family protein [Myxococcaceae bacterium]MCI0670387.1 DoxX family protein [Myxococcaceae bacterium]